MEPQTKTEIEFTLSQDGHLVVKSCSDSEIIYELTRTAREQAQTYRKSQQDPIAMFLLGIAVSVLLMGVYQILNRPSPQYLPQAHETYRL